MSKCVCPRVLSPSCGMILRVTLRPASFISLTISACGMLTMDWLFTASILSPTFSFPQRSAGLPSMMRPILWGTAVGGFRHNTLQVKTRSAADRRIMPVCAHTALTHRLTDYFSVSLILLFTPGLRKASRFFHVCGRCADAHGRIPEMCVTDILWRACIIEKTNQELLHVLLSHDLFSYLSSHCCSHRDAI